MELQDFLSKLSLPQDFTRRGFLKATSVMAAIGMMNQARAASGVRPYIVLETAKGILICDPNLCVACHRCELACTEFNEGKADPRLARIKITRNVMVRPCRHERLSADEGHLGRRHRRSGHLPPVRPSDAVRQRLSAGRHRGRSEDGARRVDKEKCIGCHLCEKACPWGMMTFDVEEKKASKCFLCDGEPKCVKHCPAAAIRYVPWMDRTGDEPRQSIHGYLPQENRDQCSICHR